VSIDGTDEEVPEDEGAELVGTFEGDGVVVRLYADRIDVAVRKRTQSIPLADVEDVQVLRRPSRLVLVTRAGKRHELALGRDTEEARAVIASRLIRSPR
jgi:hypothetical protein